MKIFKKTYYIAGAAMTMGAMTSPIVAFAQTPGGATGNNFNAIAQNIVSSTGSLPGLISALSYLFGILLGVLGVMKIKDHVENPTQSHLKDGAIRLAAGGALFALPIVFESMTNTIGTGAATTAATLKKATFNVD